MKSLLVVFSLLFSASVFAKAEPFKCDFAVVTVSQDGTINRPKTRDSSALITDDGKTFVALVGSNMWGSPALAQSGNNLVAYEPRTQTQYIKLPKGSLTQYLIQFQNGKSNFAFYNCK